MVGFMIKKFFSKQGKSLSIEFNEKKLKAMHIDEKTPLKVRFEDQKIIIEPSSAKKPVQKKRVAKKITREESFPIMSKDEEMQKSFEKVMKKYNAAFKKLAKL